MQDRTQNRLRMFNLTTQIEDHKKKQDMDKSKKTQPSEHKEANPVQNNEYNPVLFDFKKMREDTMNGVMPKNDDDVDMRAML